MMYMNLVGGLCSDLNTSKFFSCSNRRQLTCCSAIASGHFLALYSSRRYHIGLLGRFAHVVVRHVTWRCSYNDPPVARGLLSLSKIIPVMGSTVGAVAGGAIDWFFCHKAIDFAARHLKELGARPWVQGQFLTVKARHCLHLHKLRQIRESFPHDQPRRGRLASLASCQ